jgi:hypothetical protein
MSLHSSSVFLLISVYSFVDIFLQYIRAIPPCHRIKSGFAIRKKDRPKGGPSPRGLYAIYNKCYTILGAETTVRIRIRGKVKAWFRYPGFGLGLSSNL